jgi:hypothetical protein
VQADAKRQALQPAALASGAAQICTTHTKGDEGMTTDNLPTTGQTDWNSELRGAKLMIDSGLVPKDVRTPQAALFIILAGRDMGLSPVQSLRGIKPIQGKIECSADLQLGLYHRSGGKSQWVTLTDQMAELKLLATWSIEPHISRFTIEDAKRADLLSNATWRKYPKAMLRSRAITQGLKDIGFLLGAGVYAPGELGGGVTVDEATGEVLPSDAEQPKRHVEITSTAGVVEALGEEDRGELENHALTISAAIRDQQIEAALNDWRSLDTDAKVAVWAMMDKDVRKSLKAADAAAKNDAPLVPSEQEQDAAAQKLLATPTLKDALVAIRAGDHALAADIARHLPRDEAAAVEAEIAI